MGTIVLLYIEIYISLTHNMQIKPIFTVEIFMQLFIDGKFVKMWGENFA